MKIILTDNYPISKRIITDEGFLIVEGILSRTGTQKYSADQLYAAKFLKDNGVDSKKIFTLYRPPEEVFNDESLKSLNNIPITLGHPKGNIVDASNWQKLAKGEVSNVHKRDEQSIGGTLTIRAKDAVNAVNNGKKELSVGYSSHVEMKPGITPEGEQYDGIQTKIRGNHHAIVDAGRCGAMCRINDEEDNVPGEKKMTTKVVMADSMAIETDLIAAAQIERLVGERNAAMTLVDTASKQLSDLKIEANGLKEKLALADVKNAEDVAKITALEAEVKAKPSVIKLGDKELSLENAAKKFKDMEDAEAELKKKIPSPEMIDELVGKRMKTVAAGKKVAPAVVADGLPCDAYRKEVVKIASASIPALKSIADAVLGDGGLDKASEDSIKAAFNAITAAQVATEGNRKQTALGDAILDATGKPVIQVSSKQKAEDATRNAWQAKKTA